MRSVILLSGRYALARHGVPRFTGGIDIWIACEESNAEAVVHVVEKFGFKSLKFTKEDFLLPNYVHQLGLRPVRIDILTDIGGVKFENAWSRKVRGKIGKQNARFISWEDFHSYLPLPLVPLH